MTRKKYSRDYEGEAIREVYGKDDSDEEEEEIEVEYDPWDELQEYMNTTIRWSPASSWIHKWFDATDIIRLCDVEPDINAQYFIAEYLFPFESSDEVSQLLDHVWNMFEICRREPSVELIYTVALELLAERTKYYYVNPTVGHRSVVNRKFFSLEVRSDSPVTEKVKIKPDVNETKAKLFEEIERITVNVPVYTERVQSPVETRFTIVEPTVVTETRFVIVEPTPSLYPVQHVLTTEELTTQEAIMDSQFNQVEIRSDDACTNPQPTM